MTLVFLVMLLGMGKGFSVVITRWFDLGGVLHLPEANQIPYYRLKKTLYTVIIFGLMMLLAFWVFSIQYYYEPVTNTIFKK